VCCRVTKENLYVTIVFLILFELSIYFLYDGKKVELCEYYVL